MRVAWLASAVLLMLLTLTGCEQALGVDFGSFKKATCSPVSNNCFGSNACVYNTSNKSFECVPPTGTVPEYFGCSAETDCAPGLACVSFTGNAFSHCMRYCGSQDDCGPDRKCFEFNTPRALSGGGTVGACGALSTACDPLASGACGNQARCVLLDTDFTFCMRNTDTRGPGQACEDQLQCAEGSNCISFNNGNYFCRQMCLTGGSGCPGGSTCSGFNPALTLGGVEYGACQPD